MRPVARLLIVGGGCRGLRLAREAVEEGNAVRVVTRKEARRAEIEAAGAECRIGDPDRLGTLRGVLEGVTIACWLLGTATGTPEQVCALHGARLRAFLEQAIDSTMRGFVYEAAGTAPAEGERIAKEITDRNSIPVAFITADPSDHDSWVADARAAVTRLLGGRQPREETLS
jgi:hypothetical protein